jgi:hypothetical protein
MRGTVCSQHLPAFECNDIHNNSVRTPQRKQGSSVRKIKQILLHGETIVVYYENHMKHTNRACRQNANSLQLDEFVCANHHSLWGSRSNVTDYSKNEVELKKKIVIIIIIIIIIILMWLNSFFYLLLSFIFI